MKKCSMGKICEINLQYTYVRVKNIDTSFMFLLTYSYICKSK